VNPKALQEAAALDVKFKQTGKFRRTAARVPVIIKDNVDVLGMPMNVSFQGWKNFIAVELTPTLAKKIRSAGAIINREASLSEFARGGGDNIKLGRPGYARNPYNTAFATGRFIGSARCKSRVELCQLSASAPIRVAACECRPRITHWSLATDGGTRIAQRDGALDFGARHAVAMGASSPIWPFFLM